MVLSLTVFAVCQANDPLTEFSEKGKVSRQCGARISLRNSMLSIKHQLGLATTTRNPPPDHVTLPVENIISVRTTLVSKRIYKRGRDGVTGMTE